MARVASDQSRPVPGYGEARCRDTRGGRPRTLRLQDVADSAGRVDRDRVAQPLRRAAASASRWPNACATVARSLGYVANAHARSLAAGTSRSVGLVVHEIGDPYFSEIASGVLRVAARAGLTVQICHSGRDPERRAGADPHAGRQPGRRHHRRGVRVRRPAPSQAEPKAGPPGLPGARRPGRGDRSPPPRRRCGASRQPRRRPGRRRAPARPRAPPDRGRRPAPGG